MILEEEGVGGEPTARLGKETVGEGEIVGVEGVDVVEKHGTVALSPALRDVGVGLEPLARLSSQLAAGDPPGLTPRLLGAALDQRHVQDRFGSGALTRLRGANTGRARCPAVQEEAKIADLDRR